ncbi:polysaccharide biosynthesis protein [Qipengyuania citrea]|uniref:polysaccharide biosynthesis protein n=1 Tax=Qipengyuania citrea TaxID=225971 RepID=UPI0022A9AC6B|nr:nucleoside-diphosphate sugar epimerase/dehydratase [Qipengyuania citrea]MCD1590089.1 polysaccharide biosynthesis protein [Qipengyuania citrea]MCZ4264874.1 nucleoside-diphosphate sugar epimerase/dehydratase [Erythrobacter sp. G21629-S1]
MVELWKSTEAKLVGFLHQLVQLSRGPKIALLLVIDAILCVISVWIAFSLRLGVWDLLSPAVAGVIVASLAVWLPIFLARGVYRSVLRFVGSRTMLGIGISSLLMSFVLSALFIANVVPGVPRTIGVLQPMIFAVLVVVSRLFARYVFFDLLNQRDFNGSLTKVLIFGAGAAGRQLAMSLSHEPGMVLRGYIDEDARLSGQHLDGVKVYHSENIKDVVERLRIDMVLLAIPRLSHHHRKRIVGSFSELPVHVLTLPAIGDLVDGSISIENLREIEITDLLGRDPVPPNHLLLHRTISERVVLVTGAGGSIGSELARQISVLKPTAIILFEMTEYALYLVESELREAQLAGDIDNRTAIHAELGNIADPKTAYRLFERWKPHTVFHAAAYKHVPLVEENAIAGLLNNVFGTLRCALEAKRVGVKHFILVSTDKAVRPTNIMGASKRVCELILQGLASEDSKTLFAMVRFGNVLGSSGSVVPRFQRQIREGGPVTLTHRDVTRYFMTIPEAAQLVIQAGAMAEGGDVFLLDMGKAIRIYDMAQTMIRLSGLTVRDEKNPDGDIEIREVGLRNGEKMYEELLIGNSANNTSHPRIMRAMEQHISWRDLQEQLNLMESALTDGDRCKALQSLCTLVPEYKEFRANRSYVA